MKPEEEQIEICAACGVAGGKLKGVRNLFGKRVYLHVGLCIDHVKSTLEAAQEDAAEAKKIIDQYENFDLKFGEAAGKAMVEIRDLQGKLALAEAAQQKLAAVLEEAADLHMRYLAAVPGRFSDHHNDLPRERAFQAKMRSALARTEKEGGG